MALAPDLAAAPSEQGFRLFYFDLDWPGAGLGFRRALAVNPNVAMAPFGLAQLLLTQDRADEGTQHLRTARELDPMSPFLTGGKPANCWRAASARPRDRACSGPSTSRRTSTSLTARKPCCTWLTANPTRHWRRFVAWPTGPAPISLAVLHNALGGR